MTKDKALTLALEALESCNTGDYSTGHVIHPSFDVDAVNKAIDAIDEALAEQPAQQQEPEPVAGKPLPCPFCGNSGLDFYEGSTYRWGIASCSGCGASCGEIRREYPDKGEWHKEAIAEWNRRTSPPASKSWVGLSEQEREKLRWQALEEDAGYTQLIKATEAKLREKNA